MFIYIMKTYLEAWSLFEDQYQPSCMMLHMRTQLDLPALLI